MPNARGHATLHGKATALHHSPLEDPVHLGMYVGIRDLRRARGRFALVAVSIALITLLTVVLSGLTAGLAADSASAVTALPGTRVVFGAVPGQSPSFDTSSIDTADVDALAARAVSQGGRVEGLGISRTTLAGATPVPVVLFGVPTNGMQASALAGADLGPDTIVLSEPAADRADLRAGDLITLPGDHPRTVEIGPDLTHSHSPVVWIDLASWQELSGRPATVTVAIADGLSASDAIDVDPGLVAMATADAPNAIAAFSQESLSLNLINGFLIAISALVVGAFFTVWTIQRTRDTAILKALGASDRYLLTDSLGQAVLVLLASSLVGAAAGLTAGALLGRAAPFVQTIGTVGIPVAATTTLGLVGAAIAIRKVTSVDPMAALGSAR